MSSCGKYFISLDCGTTSTRAHLIDKNFKIVNSARYVSQLIENDEGIAEIDPEVYFQNIKKIISEVVTCDVSEIISIGIGCQRSTFIFWDKFTGETFHNLITWKDGRAAHDIEKTNKSLLIKFLNTGSRIMHTITRHDFFKATSELKFRNSWLNHRLQFMMKNNLNLKRAITENRAVLGCLDTWLLHRLTMTDAHLTDLASISATGIFDPFALGYLTAFIYYFKIPRSVLPKVVPNDHDFGYMNEKILGAPVKIGAVTTDQSASMIANCCFDKWSSKFTLGTGSFLDVNVGEKCRVSKNSKPLIAWSFKQDQKLRTTYKIEFQLYSSIESIKFLKTSGICENELDMSDLAESVEDSDGVIYVPINHGFVGVKNTSSRIHLLRAVLENIVFTLSYFYFELKSDLNYRPDKIRIDGGISQNNFICQSIATLTGVCIERSKDCSELTAIGAAMLAGFNCGVLKQLEDAETFYQSEKIFLPERSKWEKLYKNYQKFLKIKKKFDKLE